MILARVLQLCKPNASVLITYGATPVSMSSRAESLRKWALTSDRAVCHLHIRARLALAATPHRRRLRIVLLEQPQKIAVARPQASLCDLIMDNFQSSQAVIFSKLAVINVHTQICARPGLQHSR